MLGGPDHLPRASGAGQLIEDVCVTVMILALLANIRMNESDVLRSFRPDDRGPGQTGFRYTREPDLPGK